MQKSLGKAKKMKRKLHTFLIEEKGNIPKHKMITLGAFLASISILNQLPEIQAAHTNSYNVTWSAGTFTAEHGHHASHASHGSHASHASHASHGSHGSW